MQLFYNVEEWQNYRRNLQFSSLGFVPTMGNLHVGHASLIAASQQDNDKTVVSLFINPTQFDQADDFTHYPRSLEEDLNLLRSLNVHYCILPNEQAMYADGYRYQVQENQLSEKMEGQQRPGHFTGVLTVVMKLLNLVQPTNAYFGEKDYQQYVLIKDMAAAFFLPVNIKACATIRESSSLAYSSRNNRLNPAERQLAEKFATIFHQHQPYQALYDTLTALGVQVEYIVEDNGRRFIAVKIGKIRLIDNYAFK